MSSIEWSPVRVLPLARTGPKGRMMMATTELMKDGVLVKNSRDPRQRPTWMIAKIGADADEAVNRVEQCKPAILALYIKETGVSE